MASTRAKARCLRDFTNVGMTALEELGDLNEVIGENPKPASTGLKVVKRGKNETAKNNGEQPKPETPPVAAKNEAKTQTKKAAPANDATGQTPPAKMSEAQKRAVYNLSRRRGISVEELQKLANGSLQCFLGKSLCRRRIHFHPATPTIRLINQIN